MNEEIVGFDALYDSMEKCKRGVRWKDSVAHYHLNALEETIKLERDLRQGTYKAKRPKEFTVHSPKQREILSVSFRDRVYQRSLNDNAIYPQMSRSFIRDNCACQTGKGTDCCRDRLETFLHRYFINYGASGYVLQVDIKGYYPNMSHAVVEQTFRRKLDSETYERTVDILRTQYKGETGYNPGSQMVQIAGISVLDRVDHFVKEQLRCKYYVRYMDDLIFISQSKAHLEDCAMQVGGLLNSMGFAFNEKKTRLYRLEDGIEFLGFTFRLTDTGKVLRLISPRNVKMQRKKLARLVALCKSGRYPRSIVDGSYRCWRAHAAKGNTWKLLARMDKYYQELWRDDNENFREGCGSGYAPASGTAPG